MMLKNSNKLSPRVANRFAPFLERMIENCGDGLTAVVIYGPAADKDAGPKDPITSLFVFRDLCFNVFDNCLKTVDSGIRRGIPAPLFLTEKYIRSSTDVFPVEFLDIKDQHVLVYGEDVLSGLEVASEHIRLFCEQQVKGRMIRIRQAYLEVGLRRKGIEALLKESLASLIPIFRSLVRLKGTAPAADKVEVLEQLCSVFGLERHVFVPIQKDASDDEKIAGKDVKVFLENYLQQLSKLSQQVDQL